MVLPPPRLRLQLYQAQTDVYRRMADDFGAPFVSPPPEAVAEDGFLRPEFCRPNDPTHANELYGRLVLDQIVAQARVGA